MNHKLTYIANARMPTEKAHGIQIAKMCEAFAASGFDVELLIPWRWNRIKKGLFSYYKVKTIFTVKKLFCIDLMWLPFAKKLWFILESHMFVKAVWWHLVVGHRGSDKPLVYSRDLWPVFWLPRRFKVVYEAHSLPNKRGMIFRLMLRRVDKFVVISTGLKSDLIALNISADNIFVASDAVDLAQFDIGMTKKDARQKLDLPLDKEIVMYTGHLYAWKGAQTLLAAAKLQPERFFVFVGGTKEDKKRFSKQAFGTSNVVILGHRSPDVIPEYLKAADVVVIPNSSNETISARYTSPLKLFEYMAAKRPIVASDLSSIREMLDESTTTFFRPDDAVSLAKVIELVLAHTEESAQKSDRAYEKVKSFTWINRAQNITKFFNNLIANR